MKNLKKVLSLALAFVLVCGLMMSASAAQDVTKLSDWDDVQNKDAATLLNAFEIMQGDDRGFRPDDNVTRAEAIKMIAVALWGGVDDGSLYNTGNAGSFTDVANSFWARGHINFGVVKGIINGKGNGIFDPQGNVTGYELLKMCLTALGYGVEEEGLTGNGWDIRTMAIAQKIGLTIGYKGNPGQALTRDETALIVYNMILSQTVVYSTTTGKLIVTTDDQDTFGFVYLGMGIYTGVVIANDYADPFGYDPAEGCFSLANFYYYNNATGTYTYYDTGIQLDAAGTDVLNTVEDFRFETDLDLVGKAVRVFTKTSVRNIETVLAVATVESLNASITPNATRSNIQGEAVVLANYSNAGRASAYTVPGVFAKAPEYILNHKVDTAKWFDFNGDGKADICLINNYDIGRINAVNSKTVEGVKMNQYVPTYINYTTGVELGRTAFLEVNRLGKEIVKGDVIAYRVVVRDADTTYYVIDEILEGVEGAVTRVAFDESYAYIDGTKADVNLQNLTAAPASNDAYRMTNLGKEGTVYYFSGKIVLMDGKFAPVNYAYIYGVDVALSWAFNAPNATVRVRAILDDGTRGTYTVPVASILKYYSTYNTVLGALTQAEVNAPTVAPASTFITAVTNALNSQIVGYSVTGSEITLSVADNNTITTTAPTSGYSYVSGNGKLLGHIVDDTTVAFVEVLNPNGTYTWFAYKGIGTIPSLTYKNASTTKAVYGFKYAAGDKLNAAAFPFSAAVPAAAQNKGVYLIVSKGDLVSIVSGVRFYKYSVFNGTDIIEVTMTEGVNDIGVVYTRMVTNSGVVTFYDAADYQPRGYVTGVESYSGGRNVVKMVYNNIYDIFTTESSANVYYFNSIKKTFAIGSVWDSEFMNQEIPDDWTNKYLTVMIDRDEDSFADIVFVFEYDQTSPAAAPAPAAAIVSGSATVLDVEYDSVVQASGLVNVKVYANEAAYDLGNAAIADLSMTASVNGDNVRLTAGTAYNFVAGNYLVITYPNTVVVNGGVVPATAKITVVAAAGNAVLYNATVNGVAVASNAITVAAGNMGTIVLTFDRAITTAIASAIVVENNGAGVAYTAVISGANNNIVTLTTAATSAFVNSTNITIVSGADINITIAVTVA